MWVISKWKFLRITSENTEGWKKQKAVVKAKYLLSIDSH
jgi:hypothetical protein